MFNLVDPPLTLGGYAVSQFSVSGNADDEPRP
jgi:hypothetical protein